MSVLTILLLAAALVALAEVLTRAYLRKFDATYLYYPNALILRVLHPDIAPELNTKVGFRSNSLGERGSEPSKEPGEYYALVVGGSGSECAFLDDEQAWPFQIQIKLEDAIRNRALKKRNAHVGNLSRSEMDCEALAMMLDHLLPRYKRLDCMIIYTGFSDLIRWLHSGLPDQCCFSPIAPAEIFDVYRGKSYCWSLKGLALAELGRRARIIRARPKGRKTGLRIVEGRETRRRYFSRPIPAYTFNLNIPAVRFEENFRRLLSLCKQHSKRVLVVPQIWLDSNSCEPELDSILWFGGFRRPDNGALGFVPRESLAFMLRRFHDIAAFVARDVGVDVLDLLSAYPWSRNELYDDAHFNAHGANVIAGLVAEKLLAMENEQEHR